MNACMVLLGLGGITFCGYKVYQAWQGKAGIPFGTIVGGALGGAIGAGIGSAVAGDDQQRADGDEKEKPRPNVGGVFFWGLCGLMWLFLTVAGFISE